MKAKIIYDRKNCEGFLVCEGSDPEDFESADGGNKVDLVDGTKQGDVFEKEIEGEEQIEMAVQAAAGCPVDVIKVVDEDGNLLEGPEELPVEQE